MTSASTCKDGTSIRTYTGVSFCVIDPRPEDIHPLDIAHALSNLCRFGGHSPAFYSVAEHSLFVSGLLPLPWSLAGLLHDASEAYLGDIVSPLKQHLPSYQVLEERLRGVIEARFGLESGSLDSPEIRAADERALAIEMGRLFGSDQSPRTWSPGEVGGAFLARLHALGTLP